MQTYRIPHDQMTPAEKDRHAKQLAMIKAEMLPKQDRKVFKHQEKTWKKKQNKL